MAYSINDLTKDVYKPGEIAKMTGKALSTIQKWGNAGKINFKYTSTGRRYLERDDFIELLKKENLFFETKLDKQDVIYARVSSHKQKTTGDLDRQVTYILSKRQDLINPIVLSEVGSGLNDKRPKIQKLIKMVENDEVSRIFVTYRDRLTRFGYNYLQTICTAHGVEIVVIKDIERNKDIEQELAEDLMALIASFSGKLYGLRSHKNIAKDDNK